MIGYTERKGWSKRKTLRLGTFLLTMKLARLRMCWGLGIDFTTIDKLGKHKSALFRLGHYILVLRGDGPNKIPRGIPEQYVWHSRRNRNNHELWS